MARKRSRRPAPPPKKPTSKVGIPRAGMPTQDSVKEVVPFTSPGGRTYRIIRTSELVGIEEEVAFKLGRWLDVAVYQRRL